FDEKKIKKVVKHHLVVLEDGDEIQISTSESTLRLLLISGKPIKEPVAWSGPIVMNTQEELRLAFEEYRNGTFTKHD
ncbi:MAG: pirin family protein, partial [Candidatus Heimdallarchaeota archaeon]|nr:pirin family protein [Candidatus Heimdallarchaeota archaeon]